MSNNLVTPANNLIRSQQVSPLPMGPGGDNPVKKQMNQTNIQLAMLNAQAVANTKYDPPVPQPITEQVTLHGNSPKLLKESFTVNLLEVSQMLFVVGGLFIVYGLVAK